MEESGEDYEGTSGEGAGDLDAQETVCIVKDYSLTVFKAVYVGE